MLLHNGLCSFFLVGTPPALSGYVKSIAVGAFSATGEKLPLENQKACFINDVCLIMLY